MADALAELFRWGGNPGGKRPRDSQRAKTYRAERTTFDPKRDDLFCKPIATIDASAAFLDEVWATRWFQHRYARARKPGIRHGGGCSAARYEPDTHTLRLPVWARRRDVVLHELAHALTPRWEAAHGRRWACTYLGLVKRFLGQPAYVRLRDSFRTERVRWHPKRGPRRILGKEEGGSHEHPTDRILGPGR